MTDLPTPGNPEPDIDELLRPATVPADNGLRQRLADRTARQVRLRRWARRAAVAAGFLAAFGAGAWCQQLLAPRSGLTVPVVVFQVPPEPVAPAGPVSPAELERRAEELSEPAQSAAIFREAGDRYLTEWGDVRSALRCYRAFLDQARPADLAVARTDTWLLTSLKENRQKEDDDANATN